MPSASASSSKAKDAAITDTWPLLLACAESVVHSC